MSERKIWIIPLMDGQVIPAIGAEATMWHAGLQVLVSKRGNLGQVDWELDLCSPFWRLYVNDRSGAFIEHEGKRIPLQAGGIWIIPAWVRFQTGLNREVVQNYIHFNFTGLPSALLQRSFHRPVSLPADSLEPLMTHWREGLAVPAGFSQLCWAGALTHAAMALVLADWSEREQGGYLRWLAESTDIQPALEQIENRLASPPNNRELGQLCGSSEDHFIRKFRKILGQTPAEYGRERRIAAAAEWLTGSNRTLEEIAESAGFTDRFHLSRVFKTKLGMPPVAYRRMHRRES